MKTKRTKTKTKQLKRSTRAQRSRLEQVIRTLPSAWHRSQLSAAIEDGVERVREVADTLPAASWRTAVLDAL